MDIMEINARCLERCLPDLDAAERAAVEPYLKRLQTYLAHRPQRAEIISFDRQVLRDPHQRETVRRRRKAVAATRAVMSMNSDGRFTMTDAYADPILDWDDIAEDLALLEASEAEEKLQIDWETECYLPALGGGGMQRMIPVFGPGSA